MEEKKQEGIVLEKLDYKESSRIIKVFTRDEGVIHLIIPKIGKGSSKYLNLTTPLCLGEFTYQIKNSSLYRFIDGAILTLYPALRQSYRHLCAAGSILHALSRSQMQGKPAPLLYQLLSCYLAHLPKTPSPEVLTGSFLLKLLRHDGLLSLSPHCSLCRKKGSAVFIRGDSFCQDCEGKRNPPRPSLDWELLALLGGTKEFTYLDSLSISQEMLAHIETLFEELIN